MKTISIISQKGGAGKTTIAINLAIAAEQNNKTAVIVDLDPQASAAMFQDNRSKDYPVIISGQANRLDSILNTAEKNGADIVFIDTAPHSESTAIAAIRHSCFTLIPCRPAILDLRAIRNTIDLLKISHANGAVVFNAVPPRSNIIKEAMQALASYSITVSPVFLSHRSAYIHSLTSALGVQEYEPISKAASEVNELYMWLSKELKM